MPQSLATHLLLSNCHTRSLTIRHLSRKLERLNAVTARPEAKAHHYVQRDRVQTQLFEAASYLC